MANTTVRKRAPQMALPRVEQLSAQACAEQATASVPQSARMALRLLVGLDTSPERSSVSAEQPSSLPATDKSGVKDAHDRYLFNKSMNATPQDMLDELVATATERAIDKPRTEHGYATTAAHYVVQGLINHPEIARFVAQEALNA